MTAERQGVGETVLRSFYWDSEGRLVSATGQWGTRSYGYNGLGARVSETGGAVARSFFRDGASVLAPVLRDGTGAGSFRYTPGLSVRAHGASSSRFAHTGLKNTDAQTGAGPSPTVEASLEFDAFGGLTGLTGSWQGNYGYAGGFGYHAEPTGLKQVGHRYYDPDLGRFLSRDPIKHGPNWYAYCLNDPVNQVDPTGLQSWDSVRAYITNVWRITKDPKVMREHLEMVIDGGVRTRPQMRRIEKALEWVETVADLWDDISTVIDSVEGGHGTPPGTKGGRELQDRKGGLPRKGRYREFDIRPPGKKGRGTWRLIRCDVTGRWWFSDDHYKTFFEITR